jgi:hypothetical protein
MNEIKYVAYLSQLSFIISNIGNQFHPQKAIIRAIFIETQKKKSTYNITGQYYGLPFTIIMVLYT